MQIHGPAHVHGPQSINGPHANRAAEPQPGASPAVEADRVEISQAAQAAELAARVDEIPEVRQDLVDQLRAEIQSGRFETEERLSGAVDNLLDEIG